MRIQVFRTFTCALLFLGLCLGSCKPRQSEPDRAGPVKAWPDRRDLGRQLRDNNNMLLVYGTALPGRAEDFKKKAQDYASKSTSLNIHVVADTALNQEELQGNPLMVIGSPRANAFAGRLMEKLPVQYTDGSLHFNGAEYRDPSTVFSLSPYPSPFNRFMPVMLLGGLDDDAIWKMLEDAKPSRRSFVETTATTRPTTPNSTI